MSWIYDLSWRLIGQLADFSLRSLAVLLAAILVLAVFRPRNASARHAVWTMVLAAMLALPVLSLVLPPIPLKIARPVMRIPADITMNTPPVSAGKSWAVPAAQSPTAARRLRSWPIVAAAVYGALTLGFLLRLLVGFRFSRRLLLRSARLIDVRAAELMQDIAPTFSLRRPLPGLRSSTLVAVPLTVGWSAPAIILPGDWGDWDDWKLRAVLVHELAHIRRGDWLITVAANLNRCFFWFHPLSWWLERRLAVLAEQSSDDAALRSTGDAPRYAATILEFASALQSAGGRLAIDGIAMARSPKVSRRIERVLELREPCSGFLRGTAWMAILACALPVVYGAAAFQLNQAPGAPGSEAEMQSKRKLAGIQVISASDAERLEQRLAADPEDLEARIKLIRYYFANSLPQPRVAHTLWLIEHHPESDQLRTADTRLTPMDSAINSQADFERARVAWLRQAATQSRNPRVLANAADFIWEQDPFAAEEFFKRARQMEPSEPRWTARLAERLLRTIYNSAPPPPGAEPNRWSNPAFAEAVKRELENSTDVALIGAVGQYLSGSAKPPEFAANQAMESWLRSTAEARGQFSETLLKRAQSLDPGNPEWPEALQRLRSIREGKLLQGEQPPHSGTRIRVGAGVQENNLLRHVPPEFPALARQARLQGIVRLHVSINGEGRVSKVETVSGHPLLVPAARAAVEQWIYRPTLLNGSPVEVETNVEVPFKLEDTN